MPPTRSDWPETAPGVEFCQARLRAVPVPTGTAYYHEARFTALRPNTLYAYRVGDGSTWSEWFHFRTASMEPAQRSG